MERARFWSRVGQWFRAPDRTPDGCEVLEPADESVGENTAAGSNAPNSPSTPTFRTDARRVPRFRLTRRPSPASLQEDGYAKVVNLVESIQTHFEKQQCQAESMASSLERLAEDFSHVPEVLRTQSESLAEIQKRLEADAVAAKRLEETLCQLPQIADSQRETMVLVSRQLDLLRESGEHETAALKELREALSKLGETTAATITTLKHIHVDAEAREDRTAALLQIQTRRLTVFAVAAIVAAAVAGVASLVALWR